MQSPDPLQARRAGALYEEDVERGDERKPTEMNLTTKFFTIIIAVALIEPLAAATLAQAAAIVA